MLAGLAVPIFVLELVLTHPTYRQNFSTFVLLYAAAGAIPLAVTLPLAIRYRYWRSILWLPTWFVYAFLRRLAALEAVISLPTRPFPAPMAKPIGGAARGTRFGSPWAHGLVGGRSRDPLQRGTRTGNVGDSDRRDVPT